MSMYTIDELKELINAVDSSGINKFKIKGEAGETILISKEVNVTCVSTPTQSMPMADATVAVPQATIADVSASVAPTASAVDTSTAIKSPMVGVFYSAPSPDSSDYVTVGSSVKKGDVICIIEAMKLMNEITATHSGVIDEICVNNGDVVEFDQPLFKLK